MANEKVTIHFNSVADDGEKQDILVEGPVKIYKSVDNVEALHLLEVPEDENVFVYVRNVINSNTRQKSAFYLHDCETDDWTEVLLGSHSHTNKEILDQLGNIDVSDLADGNKILTIRAVDADGTDGNYAYKYKLEWTEIPESLPEIPEEMQDAPAYLTVENGKYTWKNEIIPAQTFQYKQVVVETDAPIKQLRVKDLNYDPKYDEILIFDGSNLLTDCEVKVEYDSESGEKYGLVQILSDNENMVFENGEKLTLLVIKSGVAGFLSQLADEYMSKADVVNLLSGKSITLDKYATKEDLKEKANTVHYHSQYAETGHLHDDRYAMYNHVHNQYITRSDVYGAISSVLSNLLDIEDPNITIDNINDTLGESLNLMKNELLTEITAKADLAYVDEEVNILKRDFLNAEHVNITVNNRVYTLKDYIGMLETTIQTMSNNSTDVKFASNIRVQLGENRTLGGYANGDVISNNTTLHEFATKLLTSRIIPELKEPEFELLVDDADNLNEPGEKNKDYNIIAHFTQNDAGDIQSIVLTVKKGDNVNQYQLRNNIPFKITDSLIYDGVSLELSATVTYLQGPSKMDNLGRSDYFVPAGTLTATNQVVGTRKIFAGKYNPTIGYRSAGILDVPEGDSFVMVVKGYQDLHDIVIAIPDDTKLIIDDIFYRNQGCYVLDLFDYKEDILIPGALEYTPVKYKVYTFHTDGVLDQTMYFDVKLKRSDK